MTIPEVLFNPARFMPKDVSLLCCTSLVLLTD